MSRTRRLYRKMTLMGKVIAPSAGPTTTIVTSSIQVDRLLMLRPHVRELSRGRGAVSASCMPSCHSCVCMQAPCCCTQSPACLSPLPAQNAAVLWESVPAEVMDAALSLHSETFRRLLPRHQGYESCADGDTFVLVGRVLNATCGSFAWSSWPPPRRSACGPPRIALPNGRNRHFTRRTRLSPSAWSCRWGLPGGWAYTGWWPAM